MRFLYGDMAYLDIADSNLAELADGIGVIQAPKFLIQQQAP